MKLTDTPSYLLLTCIILAYTSAASAEVRTLSDAEADEIIAARVAAKAKAESEHIANSVAFTVLERREISLGTRKLIANRVADPKLPKIKQPIRAKQKAINSGGLPPEFLKGEPRELHVIHLSATVYEGEPTVTHLRWRGSEANPVRYEAWSTIDWNLMRGMTTLESGPDEYLVLLGIGISMHDDEVPELPPFTKGRAEYFVFADSTDEINETEFAGIDLLHSYYDANETELKIRHQRHEALEAARKRYDAANPKKPKNTVVHFWKSEDDN